MSTHRPDSAPPSAGDQPSVLIEPPSRSVATSREAARRARRWADTQRELVWRYVAQRGAVGATQREIADALGLGRASICARVWELAGGKSGEYPIRLVRTTARREGCFVYVAVQPAGTTASQLRLPW